MSIHKYELMISEVCNLQCKHCGMSYSINNTNKIMVDIFFTVC